MFRPSLHRPHRLEHLVRRFGVVADLPERFAMVSAAELDWFPRPPPTSRSSSTATVRCRWSRRVSAETIGIGGGSSLPRVTFLCCRWPFLRSLRIALDTGAERYVPSRPDAYHPRSRPPDRSVESRASARSHAPRLAGPLPRRACRRRHDLLTPIRRDFAGRRLSAGAGSSAVCATMLSPDRHADDTRWLPISRAVPSRGVIPVFVSGQLARDDDGTIAGDRRPGPNAPRQSEAGNWRAWLDLTVVQDHGVSRRLPTRCTVPSLPVVAQHVRLFQFVQRSAGPALT